MCSQQTAGFYQPKAKSIIGQQHRTYNPQQKSPRGLWAILFSIYVFLCVCREERVCVPEAHVEVRGQLVEGGVSCFQHVGWNPGQQAWQQEFFLTH